VAFSQLGIEPSVASLYPTIWQTAIIKFNRRFGLGNGAIRKYGAKLIDYLRSGPVDYDYHGVTLRHHPTLCGSYRHMLLTPDWSDRKERRFIEDRLPHNGTFVDIGANAGFFTFFIAGKRPDARVLAFEAISHLAELIDFNIKANRLTNVTVDNVALWDHEGTVEIEGVKCQAGLLANSLKAHSVAHIDVMKIDVEGVEDRILMPFFRTCPSSIWPRALLIEHYFVDQWGENVLSFALANGYRELWRDRLNAALVRD